MSNIDKQAVQAVADLKAGYTLGHAEVAILNELARIALASIEAEAVACPKCSGAGMADSGGVYPWGEGINVPCDCTFPDPELSLLIHDLHIDGNHRLANVIQDLIEGRSKGGKIKNTAPQAPVSVPAAMGMDDDFDSAFEHGKAIGWNAYRAAMLQGAEPAQEWIPCSERMPQKNERVIIFINFNSETVPPSIHDAQFTGSTFRRGNATVNVFPLEDGYGVTHWMPIPEAPTT